MTTAIQERSPEPAVPEVLGPLDEPGITFTATGLQFEPWVSFEQWEKYGRKLQLAEKGIQWALGDWVIWGERTFKERASQAVEFTGLKVKTLQNYATVAKAIEPSRRRDCDKVDFATQAEVASLDEEDDQNAVLDLAEHEQLTRKEVRRVVSRIKRAQGKEPSEIELVHAPHVQEFLKEYLALLKEFEERVPLTTRFLRGMFQLHAAQANWQLNRSLTEDCDIIQAVVKRCGGTLDENDLYQWLMDLGYFMSDPEFEERIDYMDRDDVRMAVKTDAGEGKQENRRGKLPSIIAVPWRKVWDLGSKRERDEDDEDAA